MKNKKEMAMGRQADKQQGEPDIRVVSTKGEVTLYIGEGQAMQGWEHELMCESADLLCQYGSDFLEVGLGLGISALRIARNPNTRSHTVIEKYQKVIDLFRQQHPERPPTLELVCADFFDYVHSIKPSSYDGIFFDPALPMRVWNDEQLWEKVVPLIVRALKPQGVFIPFFSTRPEIRKQYRRHFRRVIVERRLFETYKGTVYTYGKSGDAYIQCFVRTRT